MEQATKIIYTVLIAIIIGLIVYALIKLFNITKSLNKTTKSIERLNINIERINQKQQKVQETKDKLKTIISALAIFSILKQFKNNYKHDKKIGKTVRKTLIANAGKLTKINLKSK